MWASFVALLQSRKTIAVILAVVAATTLCGMGKIPVDEFVKFTGALTAVLVAAIAAEDAAEKHKPGTPPDGDKQ